MFQDVRFPINHDYGYSGGPGFRTQIIELPESGQETRISTRSAPRYRFNVVNQIKSVEDWDTVRTFFIARRGASRSFRFKDFFDFNSSATGRGATAATDQLLGVSEGDRLQFPFTKRYSDGFDTYARRIKMLVDGTVSLANNGVAIDPGDYTLDLVEGIATFSVEPGSLGSPAYITGGFEFDVHARFGEEADALLEATYEDYDLGRVEDIPIIEIVDDDQFDDAFPYGGSKVVDPMSVNQALSASVAKVWAVNPDSAGLAVVLPDPTALPTGGPYFVVFNDAGATSIDILDHTATSIGTIAAGASADIFLGLTAAGAKTWRAA